MNTDKRLSTEAAEVIRNAIEAAGGNEVLAVGRVNTVKMVNEVEIVSMGTGMQVPALYPHMEKGDVVIHNHPSGETAPSSADLETASRLGNQGIGFFIVDNEVTDVYIVAEPVTAKVCEKLDMREVTAVIAPGGKAAASMKDYEARNEQLVMLEAVGTAFNEERISIIEAGTGIGKSFAYLIPAVFWAAKNEERVIVSTHTINLQQQIFEKDLPAVLQYTGIDVKTVIAKGRGNYICLRRLNEAVSERDLFQNAADFQAIADWAENTATGSKTDLPFFPSYQIWQTVCSETDTCIGLRCPDRERCFVLKARKEAAGASIIVTNHHLLFSDISMRLEGTGFEATAVLPPCKRFIYDEAHTMESSATSFFSRLLNRYTVMKQLNRLLRHRGGRSTGLIKRIGNMTQETIEFQAAERMISEIQQKYEVLETSAVLIVGDQLNYRMRSLSDDSAELAFREPLIDFQQAVLILTEELNQVLHRISDEFSESAEVFELETVIVRLEGMASFCKDFLECENLQDTEIFWIEKNRNVLGEMFYNLYITPVTVSDIMRQAVFEPNKTVVCTSATLSIRSGFFYWKEQMGLNGFEERIVDEHILTSPFLYSTNVLLTVPQDAPLPMEDQYTAYSAQTIYQILELSEGRGLVLFTSYRMLEAVFNSVAPRLIENKITCMKQGDDDRSRLLKKFNHDTSSVLFATDSFWQGVDSPGETLSVLIICRLPFQVPSDPVVKARMENLEKQGRNAFMEMSIPAAVIKLKQGFGRLIRKKNDRGIVVILDSRIIKKRYGSLFLGSLPETIQCFKETKYMLEDIERFLYP